MEGGGRYGTWKASVTDCSKKDYQPGTDDVSCIQIDNLFKANCKYVNGNTEVSIIVHRFYTQMKHTD